MKVFVVICCDIDNGSILFVDSVRKNEQDAINFCTSLNADSRIQEKEIYFTYNEETVL
jgi:hypothetical protein